MLHRSALVLVLALVAALGIASQSGVALASGYVNVSCGAYDSHSNGVSMSGQFFYDGQHVSNVTGPNVTTQPQPNWNVISQQSGFTVNNGDYSGFYWANVTFQNTITLVKSSLYPRINVNATGTWSDQNCG